MPRPEAPGPAGPILLRLFRPADAPTMCPTLIYYHGGGWVVGGLDSHDGVCRILANAAACAVVAVDYRLAPEHRFPAAVDDCSAATEWVMREAASLGLDPSRFAVGGDSAGGNLAAVMAILARDRALPTPPVAQLLIYPATDLVMNHPSYARVTDGLPLTAATMRWFGELYCAAEADRTDWRASPLRAASLGGHGPGDRAHRRPRPVVRRGHRVCSPAGARGRARGAPASGRPDPRVRHDGPADRGKRHIAALGRDGAAAGVRVSHPDDRSFRHCEPPLSLTARQSSLLTMSHGRESPGSPRLRSASR